MTRIDQESLYQGSEDRARLLAMPEAQREEILAERHEKKLKAARDQKTLRQLRRKKALESKNAAPERSLVALALPTFLIGLLFGVSPHFDLCWHFGTRLLLVDASDVFFDVFERSREKAKAESTAKALEQMRRKKAAQKKQQAKDDDEEEPSSEVLDPFSFFSFAMVSFVPLIL